MICAFLHKGLLKSREDEGFADFVDVFPAPVYHYSCVHDRHDEKTITEADFPESAGVVSTRPAKRLAGNSRTNTRLFFWPFRLSGCERTPLTSLKGWAGWASAD